tara:strand:+ start:334 stop:1095 length:762 start_codon:yes stop_codon:yes gene_type:complete
MSKIIKTNSDNVVFRAYDNDIVITLESKRIRIKTAEGVGVEDIWDGKNSSTATVHENVTLPSEFIQHKFKYDGSSWSENSDWIDLEILVAMDGLEFGEAESWITEDLDTSETEITISATTLEGNSHRLAAGRLIKIHAEEMTISAINSSTSINVVRGKSQHGATNEAVDASETEIDCTRVRLLKKGNTIQIDDEQMTVTLVNMSTKTLTVTRGVNSTSAAEHTTDTPIYRPSTAATHSTNATIYQASRWGDGD